MRYLPDGFFEEVNASTGRGWQRDELTQARNMAVEKPNKWVEFSPRRLLKDMSAWCSEVNNPHPVHGPKKALIGYNGTFTACWWVVDPEPDEQGRILYAKALMFIPAKESE